MGGVGGVVVSGQAGDCSLLASGWGVEIYVHVPPDLRRSQLPERRSRPVFAPPSATALPAKVRGLQMSSADGKNLQ